MLFNFNIIPATIKAITKLVQVLDKCPGGARRLITLMVTTTALAMAMQLLPAVLQLAGPAPGTASLQR